MSDSSNAELVLHVSDVAIDPRAGGGLLISCVGEVSSSGWTSAELRLASSDDDEVLNFNFVALPPIEPAVQLIEETRADYYIDDASCFQSVGVRSKSRTISIDLPLGKTC